MLSAGAILDRTVRHEPERANSITAAVSQQPGMTTPDATDQFQPIESAGNFYPQRFAPSLSRPNGYGRRPLSLAVKQVTLPVLLQCFARRARRADLTSKVNLTLGPTHPGCNKPL